MSISSFLLNSEEDNLFAGFISPSAISSSKGLISSHWKEELNKSTGVGGEAGDLEADAESVRGSVAGVETIGSSGVCIEAVASEESKGGTQNEKIMELCAQMKPKVKLVLTSSPQAQIEPKQRLKEQGKIHPLENLGARTW